MNSAASAWLRPGAARPVLSTGSSPRTLARRPSSLALRRHFATLAVGLHLFGTATSHAQSTQQSNAKNTPPDFTREVRPILSRHCFKCHGPDDLTRKGKLRLDIREDALKAGKSGAIAIVPGQPDHSEFIKRILTSAEEDLMPPPETKQPLTESQKDILRRWIQSGAEYQQHWAFEVPKSREPGALQNPGWARNTIDRFVLQRLEHAGLRPAPAADPVMWLRRVSLDLIGLAPLPAEVDSFLAEFRKDPVRARETRVDELLASPRYGERWARRWLDLARYADTNGYEKDRDRSIWPYRDWVIRALNADMPFDQFSIWQLAGDLIPSTEIPAGTPPLDPLIATGFHRNTMLNEEGGIDPLEFRFHAMTDRVATTGTAWLGLTLQCAQCHTHKYDPIPHREYYQLMACLNNADEPEVDLPDPKLEQRHAENLAKIPTLIASLAEKWPVDSASVRWHAARPITVTSANKDPYRILEDDSVLFSAPGPDKDLQTFVLETTQTNITHLRVEALTDDSLPSKGPGRVAHGNFVLTEIRVQANPRAAAPGNPGTSVRIASATADAEQKDYPVANAFDGKSDSGWGVHAEGKPLNANHQGVFRFEKPISFPGGARLTVVLEQHLGGHHTMGRVRLATGEPNENQESLAQRRQQLLQKAFSQWVATETAKLVRWKPLRPAELKSNLPVLELQPDDSVLASGDITKSDTYTLGFGELPAGTTALRLEALPDDRLPAHGPGLTYYEGPKGDFFLGEFELWSHGTRLPLTGATDSYSKNNFGSQAHAALAIDGDPQTGWSCAGRTGAPSEAVFRLTTPTSAGQPAEIRLRFGRHYACSLGRFRISYTTDTKPAVASGLDEATRSVLAISEADWTPAQREAITQAFLLSAPELATERAEIERLRRAPAHPTTLVLRDRPSNQPRPTFIHKRGEFLQPTEAVSPGVLSVLNPAPRDTPINRLTLARWLVSKQNPLTARVTVNRAWQAFFGKGLVKTTEDFGLQGEAPSHPELLDWLALEFMNQGWSPKKLHRLIATSATYQMGSEVTPEALAKAATIDPENRWLSRFPRTRLEAEVLRDSYLRASGLLSEKMGGPGVRPPQPDGITEAAYGQAKWNANTGEDRHRRSVYTYLKRTAPFAFYNTFDAPSGEACIARRDVANTPLQALTVLNDILIVEISQAFGREFAAMQGTQSERLTQLVRRCLTRPPSPDEVNQLGQFLDSQRRRFQSGELNAALVAGEAAANSTERAIWTSLARVLLNLDESITKG